MIAATDYMKTFADQIRPFVPGRYRVLGTDGFGRSDYRRKLRAFFEVDRHYVAVAALKSLADEGKVKPSVVSDAIRNSESTPRSPARLKSRPGALDRTNRRRRPKRPREQKRRGETRGGHGSQSARYRRL